MRRLLNLPFEGAGFLTVGMGLVGAVRRRRELARIRSGRLAPSSSTAWTLPPRREGRWARRAAAWVPSRPATPLGRFAAAAWAGPVTLLGLVFGLSTRGRRAWSPEHGCLVIHGGRGGSHVALRAFGLTANALGQVVVSVHEEPSRRLLAHEAVHVRQAERLGPLLLPAYLWWAGRHGYRDHPLERAARLGARRATSATGSS